MSLNFPVLLQRSQILRIAAAGLNLGHGAGGGEIQFSALSSLPVPDYPAFCPLGRVNLHIMYVTTCSFLPVIEGTR